MKRLGCIGGTGLDRLPGLELLQRHSVQTPWGIPSEPVAEGALGPVTLFYLHRHGGRRMIPPHAVNYRANVRALHDLGAEAIVAVNAVGGIAPRHEPGDLVIPGQIIDYTWGREHTYDDGARGELLHVDFTEPYDGPLRSALLAAAARTGVDAHDGGVLGVTQGPRLETAAEIRRLARDGCDLVGMTGMPEAALARELGIPYASICIVVNRAAGLGEGVITLADIRAILARRAVAAAGLVAAVAGTLSAR